MCFGISLRASTNSPLAKCCFFSGHPGCRQHDADPWGLRRGHEQVQSGGLRRAGEPSSVEQHWHVFLWEKEIRSCE